LTDALMMVAVSTFETSANFHETTRRGISDGRHENLKSHPDTVCFSETVPSAYEFTIGKNKILCFSKNFAET
jgi:hypothetical protein